MTRLLALAVLAAVIVPTAILGGGGGIEYAFRGYTVQQVERVFGAEGISLQKHVSGAAPLYTVKLVGRFPDRTKVHIQVFVPPPRTKTTSGSGGSDSIVVLSSGSGAPRAFGSAYQENVLIGWQTTRSCSSEAALVRAALARLPIDQAFVALEAPSGVSCYRVPRYP